MIRRALLVPTVMGGAQTYTQKVLGVQSANLIGAWLLNETSGPTASDSSSKANNGSYSGPTLANAAGPDGVLVPSFDGSDDFINLLPGGTTLATDVSKTAGSLVQWIKVSALAVWTDLANRSGFTLMFVNTANIIEIRKTGAAGLKMAYTAGATDKGNIASITTRVDWVCAAITWNTTADEVKTYIDGSQEGATLTGLVQPSGSLTASNIGARQSTPDQLWKGWLGPTFLWSTTLTPTEIGTVSTV